MTWSYTNVLISKNNNFHSKHITDIVSIKNLITTRSRDLVKAGMKENMVSKDSNHNLLYHL